MEWNNNYFDKPIITAHGKLDLNIERNKTDEEIREDAMKFCESFLPKYQTTICKICNTENCINNEYCHNCGCQV